MCDDCDHWDATDGDRREIGECRALAVTWYGAGDAAIEPLLTPGVPAHRHQLLPLVPFDFACNRYEASHA